MRKRGVGVLKRVEIWCPTRASARDLHQKLTRKAKKKEGHISLGQSYYERKKKRSTNPAKQTSPPNASSVKTFEERVLLMHWNARSLKKKTEELKREITDKNVKIICIQESSLPKDTSFHPKFKNFSMFNLSREDNFGGGLVTLIHDSLHVEDCAMMTNNNIEYMKMKIRVTKDCVFTLINVYIPSQGIQEKDLDVLVPDSQNFVLMGDFNSKHRSWNNGPENRNGPVLFRWIQTHKVILLNQNKKATYQSPSTGTLSTLDLTLASPAFERSIKNWCIGEDLGSDHFPVFFELTLTRKLVHNPSVVHSKYNMKKANWEAFMTASELLDEDCCIETIEKILHNAAEKAIPQKKPYRNPKHMNSWWNDEIRALRRKRQGARKKWKKNRNKECRQTYNKWNAILRRAILAAKRKSWKEFVGSINMNTPSSEVWKKFRAIEGETGKKIEQIKSASGEWLDEDKDLSLIHI